MKGWCFTVFYFFVLCCFAQRSVQVAYDVDYHVAANQETKKIELTCLIPQTLTGIQQLEDITFSIPPDSVFTDQGNKYAYFLFSDAKAPFVLSIHADLSITSNDLAGAVHDTDDHAIAQYLVAEQYIESEAENIAELATQLKKKDDLATVKNIFAFIRNKMHYSGYNPNEVGASKALAASHGDCTEFADLFVALCRANHIPARVLEGFTTESQNVSVHNWAEVFLKDIGWVRFDPTVPVLKGLKNRYVQLSSIRNDQKLQNKHFYCYRYWGTSVAVKMVDNVKVKQN